jgi:hypothetical protein
MLPAEGTEILRVAILSVVIGFAGFCISYGVYVWRKRNATNRRPRSRSIMLAQVTFLLSCATIAVSWAFNEFQGRSGIAGGSDIFVVNARGESFAQRITSAERVAKGDLLAEFLSPADRTRLAGIDLQISQAKAKKQAIGHKVLQYDEALLQEQAHLQSELLQDRGFASQLQNSDDEVERERATLTTDWTREEGKLLEDLAEAERELASALGQREITQRGVQRAEELQKQGNFSRQQLDQRSADDLTAQLSVEKNKQAIVSLKERHAALSSRFESSVSSLDHQISELSADRVQMAATIKDVARKLDIVQQKLRTDHDRAIAARQGEVDAVDYDISILAAEKTRLMEIGEVRAPFAGKVVYRNSAPGLASANSSILAISAGTGFSAAIRLPRRERRELAAQTDPVELALDTPVLNQFFTGRFVRSEPVPFEPDRVIAYFDCNLPPEIIGYLGNAVDPVRVRLLWRPSLWLQPGFEFGIFLVAGSFFWFAMGVRNLVRPTRYLPREIGSHASAASPDGTLRLLSATTRREVHDRSG